MNLRVLALSVLLSAIVLPYAASQTASANVAASALTAVPPLVPYSGRAEGRIGQSSVTFLIFRDQQGGEPLFTESQIVSFDEGGRYKVQLGAANPNGLPSGLFSSGEARWLEVQISGIQPEPRILLASVPYALKAADAATLGGLPASAFALANGKTAGVNASGGVEIVPNASSMVTTTGGNANNVARFSGTNTIVNSVIYDNGTNVGIGTTTPTATLTDNGTLSVAGVSTFNNYMVFAPTGTATANTPHNSEAIKLYASAFNSSSKSTVTPHFQWQAEPTGNNTAAPNGTLNLLATSASSGSTETGFYFNTDGTIHFAPGQVPPKGSLTSVGLSAPSSDFAVTGSPVTAAGTLGLNWKVAPTNANNANAIVKRDSSGSFTAGAITAALGMQGTTSASTGIGVAGINNGGGTAVSGMSVQSGGIGVYGGGDIVGVEGVTPGGNGVYGQGDVGIWGQSTGTNGGSDGVHGVTTSAGGSGVAGVNSAGGTGVYGTGGTGVFGTGSNYGFVTDSNVSQATTAGGWVKAMIEVDENASIVRCFNSTLAGSAATTPPCGIDLEQDQTGVYRFNFNFDVSSRFYSTQILNDSTLALAVYRSGNGGQGISVYSYYDEYHDLENSDFQLMVF